MKNKWLMISTFMIFSLMLLVLLLPNPSYFLTLSDVYFIVSALLLVSGLFGWILKNGTFDFFHYSLIKAKNRLLSSQKDDFDRSNEENLHRLSRAIPSFYPSLLKAGTLFLLCSILCTILYSFQDI